MSARLLKRLKDNHAGNAEIHIIEEDEVLVFEPTNSDWRVFMGFGGHVEFVCGDDVIGDDDPLEDGAEALEWYHDQLLYRPGEYAKHLLDRSGLVGEYADEEKPDGGLRDERDC